EIHAWCDLDELQADGGEPEDAALGDVEHRFSVRGGVLAGEGALLDCVEELGGGRPVGDDEPPVAYLGATGYEEGAQEHHLLGVLADIDESTGAGQRRAEPADVDVALP